MAVFRVEKTRDYTVMANHHLRNKTLTLKAKGLLSLMLSLPEDWDYTLKGLSYISVESIDAIREAVKQLERTGYIVRSRQRNKKGQFEGADYVIYELPRLSQEPPVPEAPALANPTLGSPLQVHPALGPPVQDKPMQLNTNVSSTNLINPKKSNMDLSNPSNRANGTQAFWSDGRGRDQIPRKKKIQEKRSMKCSCFVCSML